ncbi:MAG: NAD(P)/FAD-dependent oxidoreductase [Leptolyngbyaceae cyanobacterium]
MTSSKAPTIIIGAGFSGLFTALHLNNQGYPHPIILIEKSDRFCFKPLLYDYMSGEMQSYQITPLYIELLHDRDISFIKGTVISIDLETSRVCLEDGRTQEYGNLVVAAGSVPAFFAEGAAEHAFTFHSKADVDALKHHIMTQCRKAAQEPSPEVRRSLLTVAIVGGGPVGVELALTLGDVLPQWYESAVSVAANETASSLTRELREIRIVLLNRSDILNGDVNKSLRDTAMAAMASRTVSPELMLGASVRAVRSNSVEFTRNSSSECLTAGTIVWTAGTSVHPLVRALPVPKHERSKRGHLLVKPTLQLLSYPNVFAAGDCAVIESDEEPLPATAQVAYQQGEAIAQTLMVKAKQKDPLPSYTVGLRGTIMKLGMGTAVANIFDRYEVVGTVGQAIRQVMYLGLMPTPIYNARTILGWIKDDIFEAHAGERYDIDYTAGYEIEELIILGTALTLSATAVSRAEIGIISDQLESVALRRALAGATSRYPNNSIIRALFGHRRKRDFFLRTASSNTLDGALKKALTKIQQSISILAERTPPEEVCDYKEFVYYCCDCVARAAGTTPVDKQLISAEEEAVLATIKTALGLSRDYPDLPKQLRDRALSGHR